MMQRILKGDTSGQIALALADGYNYAGCVVEFRYQGAVRTFRNCEEGQTIQFNFTAAETAVMALGAFPVTVRLFTPDGRFFTVNNADVKIEVTDCVADVREGGVIVVEATSGLYGVDDLPERYTTKDIREKINEIIQRLGGGVAALCLAACVACGSLFGAGVTVQKANLEDIHNDEKVVTGVTFDASGLATTQDLNAHKDNTGNPHGVTAQQAFTQGGSVGVPATFGSQVNFDGESTPRFESAPQFFYDVDENTLRHATGGIGFSVMTPNSSRMTSQGIVFTPSASSSSQVEDFYLKFPHKSGVFALMSDIPVSSVNNKTGAVTLTAGDVGAIAKGENQAATFSLVPSSRLMGGSYTTFESSGISHGPRGGSDSIEPDYQAWDWLKFTTFGLGTWIHDNFISTETDPTVPGWAKAENPPEGMTDNAAVLTNGVLQTKGGTAITAGNVGAATPGQVQTAIANAGHATDADLAPIRTKVEQSLIYSSGVYQYMTGNTNAWFSGTNYVTTADGTTRTQFVWEDGMDAGTVPCSMSLWEIRDGQKVVWDQRDWTVWYWNFKAAQLSNNLARVTGDLAEEVNTNCMKRGWAKYTAVRGLDNPDPSTLWIDTPKVQLMAGHQWEKIVEVGGAGYWTISGNGIELSQQDAESTFLTIKDFEGNACLTFRKTSSYLVYCQCGTDIVSNYMDAQNRVVFHLTTDVQPTAEFSTTLEDDSFVEEGTDGCPANYEWTGSAGSWDCHFILKPGITAKACFARFKVMREGENVVEHTVPIKINGGIVFEQNGQTLKCKPVAQGTSVGSTVNWVIAQ